MAGLFALMAGPVSATTFGDIDCNDLPTPGALEAGDTVDGNLTVSSGDCIVDGTVDGNIINHGSGDIALNGSLNGNIELEGEGGSASGGGSINGNIVCNGTDTSALFPGDINGNVDCPLEFPQGIASGDATSTSAVLWTRVNQETDVEVEVSTDPTFQNEDAFEATMQSLASDDFVVKTVAEGLANDTAYFYRFRRDETSSEVGSFRTAPLPGATRNVRFAFSGDSDGTMLGGVPFFNDFEALDRVRQESDLDFFVYLGDQIYSDSFVRSLAGMGPAVTLEEYRETYRVNRSIAALPDLLASLSLLTIWDDHEVVNDYDGQTVDPARYANGRRAYFDYLPSLDAGLPSDPVCAGDPLFRRFRWGQAVEIIIPDERSCRSADVEAACAGDLAPTLPAARMSRGARRSHPHLSRARSEATLQGRAPQLGRDLQGRRERASHPAALGAPL